eukprot:TRINITY_DN5148_c0_g1_i1.p1 TRINITY_DN5148_c0_g1~~TRINITY_DN5148_c0_g1_i1.p1  ORF type:complete len:128 (-),score=42.75 TRINITY_DN5148_c0_g1_i1:20-403(-)
MSEIEEQILEEQFLCEEEEGGANYGLDWTVDDVGKEFPIPGTNLSYLIAGSFKSKKDEPDTYITAGADDITEDNIEALKKVAEEHNFRTVKCNTSTGFIGISGTAIHPQARSAIMPVLILKDEVNQK